MLVWIDTKQYNPLDFSIDLAFYALVDRYQKVRLGPDVIGSHNQINYNLMIKMLLFIFNNGY